MSTIRIVLADDHDIVRHGLRTLLDATEGMIVVGEARDGLEAIACVEALQPNVVVMDVSMPRMDGAEATRRISREHPHVAVVAFTAHDDPAHLVKLQQAGAAGYVVKRSVPADLIQAIRAISTGGRYWDRLLSGAPTRAQGEADANTAIVGPVDTLSSEEEAVLRAVADGKSNATIAGVLGMDVGSVEVHKSQIMRKLGLRGRTAMVRYAEQQGWRSDR